MGAPRPNGLAAGGFASRFLLRPWFDRVALDVVVRGLSPLSRLWAAALEAPSSASLQNQYPTLSLGRALDEAFRSLHRRADDYAAAETRWQAAFFDTGHGLETVHAARGRAARRLMASRVGFMAVPGWWRVPPVIFWWSR